MQEFSFSATANVGLVWQPPSCPLRPSPGLSLPFAYPSSMFLTSTGPLELWFPLETSTAASAGQNATFPERLFDFVQLRSDIPRQS